MNRNGSNDPLAQWLPILETYRAKLDMDSANVSPSLPSQPFGSEESGTPTALLQPVPTAAAEQQQDNPPAKISDQETSLPVPLVAAESADPVAHDDHPPVISYEAARHEIVVNHLPIDGILKQLQKTKPFLLGACFVSDTTRQSSRAIGKEHEVLWERSVEYLADRCCEKASKKTIVIKTHSSSSLSSLIEPNDSLSHRRATWIDYEETKAGKARWYAQMTELAQWKLECDLILFDLGEATSSMASKVGRLCHGIVVQLPEVHSARKTIRVLKSLQDEQLKILGVWTIENLLQGQGIRSRAA